MAQSVNATQRVKIVMCPVAIILSLIRVNYFTNNEQIICYGSLLKMILRVVRFGSADHVDGVHEPRHALI